MKWQFGAALVLGARAVCSTTSAADDHVHTPATASAPSVVAMDVFAQPTSIDLLLVEARGKTFELYHQRSTDGGSCWTARHKIDRGGKALSGPHRGMDPQIAAIGNTLVAMWTTPGTDKWGSGPLATSVSHDGGRTWTPVSNPSDEPSTEGHAFLELSADAQGAFHAFWLDSRDGGQGLRTAVSSDQGRTWSANVTVDNRTCECCWNKALTSDSRTFVLYRDKDPRDMALAVSADDGRTWKRQATVGTFNWQFDGCPHVGGGLTETRAGDQHFLHAVVWTGAEGREGLYALRSGDDGVQWSAPQHLGTISARHADLAALGRDVFAVWDESGNGQTAIRVARSRDQGATWETPRTLSKAPQASHPLLVSSRGRVIAFWTEKAPSGALAWKSARVSDSPDATPPATASADAPGRDRSR